MLKLRKILLVSVQRKWQFYLKIIYPLGCPIIFEPPLIFFREVAYSDSQNQYEEGTKKVPRKLLLLMESESKKVGRIY